MCGGTGRVLMGDIGARPCMVRAFSTQSPWTADPLLLKGFLCLSSGFVMVLWFECVQACVCLGDGVRLWQLEVKVLPSADALAV